MSMRLMYSHALGIFLQGILHVTELWPETLDVLLELQLSLLAALQLCHFLIKSGFHTVKLHE